VVLLFGKDCIFFFSFFSDAKRNEKKKQKEKEKRKFKWLWYVPAFVRRSIAEVDDKGVIIYTRPPPLHCSFSLRKSRLTEQAVFTNKTSLRYNSTVG